VTNKQRCGWVKLTNPLYIKYHDTEWGKPVYDDQHLFEMLCLEGQQAGISWEVILNKREGYKKAFDNFDIDYCATLTDEYLESQVTNPGIIRSKNKIFSIKSNAQAALSIIKDHGSLSSFLWKYVGGKPIINTVVNYKEAPTQTAISVQLSKDLKKYGFKFLGPVICYAFMQGVGMVNDHETNCDFKS
jgi:DNA-3-methyladenine glycosylase I